MFTKLALFFIGAKAIRPDAFAADEHAQEAVSESITNQAVSEPITNQGVASLASMNGTDSNGPTPAGYTSSALAIKCRETNKCGMCRSFNCNEGPGSCADGCKSEKQAQACCSADASCTAVQGGGEHWWSYHGVCNAQAHPNNYRVCHKLPAGGYECTPNGFKCEEGGKCAGQQCRDFECAECGGKCLNRGDAIACCESLEKCTAVYGGGSHWWTFYDECTEKEHFNYYTVYHKTSKLPSTTMF